MRLLIVEDEGKVAAALQRGLEGEGYAVCVEGTGEAALMRGSRERFDLILLDLGLPDRDGLTVMEALRDQGVTTPVLMLTARDTVGDRVIGLNTGADDYLVKPFAFAELLARVHAIVRRGRVPPSRVSRVSDLVVHAARREVTRAGRVVELTAKEFVLLDYLVRHEGQVVSRETLAREVWKETVHSTTMDNIIDVHISRLRRKVDFDRSVKLIHTVRGVGFVVREQSS